ncbi:ATP-binding protein [Streptomyces sp. NPDC029674]|uniref:ATP-binding protein n=1 Tax=Streptomyces sp. NPDC029674 TaxID=3365297 RepID=UPI00384B87B7
MPDLKAPPARDWVMGYPMALATVRLARRHVRHRLTTWEWTGDIDDAVLVVSELLANAVRHGRLPGHHVWLRLAVEEGAGLVVDVSDPVPMFPGFDGGFGAAVDEGEGGRGLLVVRQLTVEFEWFPRTGVGKTVRARLAEGARG